MGTCCRTYTTIMQYLNVSVPMLVSCTRKTFFSFAGAISFSFLEGHRTVCDEWYGSKSSADFVSGTYPAGYEHSST